MSTGPAVDPRGPRFAAILTTIVLAVVLVTEWWPLASGERGFGSGKRKYSQHPIPNSLLQECP